jgi:hypothetical protein
MRTIFRSLLFAVLAAGVASAAEARELTLKMADGRVTLIAKDVPVRQILAEWARVGNTRMVNAEKVPGGPVTLQLVDVPEKEALDVLLRAAAGYVTASRETPLAGASQYDRVIILATSRPPAAVAAAPTPFARPVPQAIPPPQPPPDVDDEGEPTDQGAEAPAEMTNPGMPFPGPNPAMPNPNGTPAQPAAPMTAPRPGMLPQPQPTPANPYTPMQPGLNGRPYQFPGSTGRGSGPGEGGQQ